MTDYEGILKNWDEERDAFRSRVEELEAALGQIVALHETGIYLAAYNSTVEANLEDAANIACAALNAQPTESDDDGHISREMMQRFHSQSAESEE